MSDLTKAQQRLLTQQEAALRLDRSASVVTAVIWVSHVLAIVIGMAIGIYGATRHGAGWVPFAIVFGTLIGVPISFAASYMWPAWARADVARSLAQVQIEWDAILVRDY